MKRSLILFIVFGSLAILLCSYRQGAAFFAGVDATGASGGGGCTCHNSTSKIGTKVELDSAGVAVSSYHPGTAYMVKISADNSGTSSWPDFGFQVTVVKLSGAGTASAIDAGTWGSTLPTDVQNTPPSSSGLPETIIEQDQPIPATTGSGSTGTTYVESIPWTAPASGTGSVKIYGVINAVNNNTNTSGDGYQVATAVTITEATATASASVSIALTSGSNPSCSGSSLTFTVTPTNGGSSPTYQWMVNGTNVGTNSTTYTTTTLTNGAVVTCTMTPSGSSAVTSNSITMTINTSVTPSVSISASSTTICSGASAMFTATPTNGGTSPSYQWKVNGTNAGTNSFTFSSITLTNGAVVTCVLTSNAACASPTTATSNSVTMTVNSTVTPSVSISGSPTTICNGESASFTATPTNGGASPSYQWKVDGTNAGTNSATFSSSTLTNGAVVTCGLTSNAACASPVTATSNSITITVNSTVIPSVTINSNVGNSICAGQSVTLTATPVNGGTNPTYNWVKNGNNIPGATSPSYTTTALVTGDIITCSITSNASCASPDTATSTGITFTTVTNATPSVSITTSGSDSICASASLTFTAIPVNGGSNPSYQWFKNSSAVNGATSASYTGSSFANSDAISVQMTSNSTCVSSNQAFSNAITITIISGVTPVLSISSGKGLQICASEADTFTASGTNAGSSPTYQWKKNGNVAGGNSNIYVDNGLATGDVISCIMTSSLTCASPSTATSNSINMTVHPLPSPTISEANDTLYVTSSYQYEWFENGVSINGATGQSYLPLSNGNYTARVTTQYGCQGQTANYDVTYVTAVNQLQILSDISIYPNPAGENLFIDMARATGFDKINIRLYDLSGRLALDNQNTPVDAQKIALNITQINAGVYILQINRGDENAYKKLVISR